MANSGTVTAGSAALASQYNNLRDDVLNVSTGHTHTGASEDGKQVEGTAIASTGATVGYVLTAGTGGTATNWSALPAGGGELNFLAPNYDSFATAATADGTPFRYTSFNQNGYGYNAAVFHSGTVVAFLQNGSAAASTYDLNLTTIQLGNATSIYNSTISLSTGGSTYMSTAGDSYKGGTAFVAVWSGALSSTYQARVAKINKNGTVMWNTQIHSFTTNGSAVTTSVATGQSGARVRYASAPDVYYFADTIFLRTNVGGTAVIANGTARISNVWIVNNTSGSAYSATFGSASVASTSTNNGVTGLVFVPDDAGTPTAGTIHAWGFVDGTARYCTYSVGSASISAVSTADAVGLVAPWLPSSSMNNVAFRGGLITQTSSTTFTAWDRTGGTLLHRARSGNGIPGVENSNTAPEDAYDEVNGVMATSAYFSGAFNNSTLTKVGGLNGSFPPMNRWLYNQLDGGSSTGGALCGNGSATHWVWWFSNGGTAATIKYNDMPGLAKVAIDTAGSGNRWYTNIYPSNTVLAYETSGTSSLTTISRNITNLQFDLGDNLITSGGTAYVWVTKTGSPLAVSTAVQTSWAAPGGSASVSATKISLG
jgi:hypothetical protein